MVAKTQARYSQLQVVSFDKGYLSRAHRGLDRVRSCGANGFEFMVALSFNLHRISLLL